MSSGGGPPGGVDRYLLDVLDPPDYGTGLAAAMLPYLRRGAAYNLVGPVWELQTAFNGGAARRGGISWAEATSALNTPKTRSSARWNIPIGHDLANTPAVAIWPMRYRLETLVWRVNNPIIADVPLAMSVITIPGGAHRSLDEANTVVGYEIISRSTINAGRWTIRVRLATAGAITILQDTGLDPTNAGPMHLEIRYDYNVVPRLSARINGAEFGILSGVAAMPVMTANGQLTGLCQGLTVGGGVGQVDVQRQTRFRVEMLPGFPE